MADASARTLHQTQKRSGHNAYPIANGVTVYEGMLCQLESGYVNHWDETGSFLGIITGDALGISPGEAITGNTSGSPVPEARVDESGPTLMHLDSVAGTPTQAKVGDLVYSADSNVDSLTLTDTTNPPVGYMSKFRSATDVDVTLFTPAEHKAGIADATWNT